MVLCRKRRPAWLHACYAFPADKDYFGGTRRVPYLLHNCGEMDVEVLEWIYAGPVGIGSVGLLPANVPLGVRRRLYLKSRTFVGGHCGETSIFAGSV